jgi:hypothetical protein
MNNEDKVKALLASGKSSEDIVKFLVMNDDYRTGPEARTALETFMAESGLVQTKKVPMSEQYKSWYTALSRSDKMACTKQSLHAQAVAIGMSEKSADWYARVYLLAGTLALEMSMPVVTTEYDELGRPTDGTSPWKTTAEVKAEMKAEPEYGAWYKALDAESKKAWMAAETGSYLGDYSEACFADLDGNSTYSSK